MRDERIPEELFPDIKAALKLVRLTPLWSEALQLLWTFGFWVGRCVGVNLPFRSYPF